MPPSDSGKIRISLAKIIYEGGKRREAVDSVRRKYYFFSPVIISGKNIIEDMLSEEELGFYRKLVRFKDISNAGIIAKLNISPDTYWERITIFFLSGILDFMECKKDQDVTKNIVDLIQMRSKLEKEGLSFFDVLMVDKNDSLNSIRAKYMELAQKYKPERFGSALAPEIKQSAKFVLAKMGEAYRGLRKLNENKIKKKLENIEKDKIKEIDIIPDLEEKSDDNIHEQIQISAEPEEFLLKEKIWEIDAEEIPEPETIEKVEKEIIKEEEEINEGESLEEKVSTGEDQQKETKGGKNLINEARMKYLEANDFHQRKMYDEAVPLLKQAVKLEPNKFEYFYLLGVCQSYIMFFYAEAERNLKKAIEINPIDPEPVFALGELYKKEQKKNLARKCFQRTLSIEPGYIKALQGIKSLNVSSKGKKKRKSKKK